jgi:hypothetical protein
VLNGWTIWPWAIIYGPLVFTLLMPWFIKRVMEYGESLPPATPKSFGGPNAPFWWRYIDVYLVIASAAWILLLLVTSIAAAPEWMFRDIFFVVAMGPLVVVGAASLVEALFRRPTAPPS